ncbi:MAG TPA: LOG family protein [Anaerolineaceae bacterium]|nr:LOG family protein [Anaerolineaceae bacterium]
MKVTVFGGSSPKPGETAYEEAFQLGQSLAQAGFTVLTGGYTGIMEAISKGAAESGGHVIGVTCEEIERWRPTKANAWVQEEWHFQTLNERLMALSDGGDAVIALPGGIGTLTEICMLWNRMVVDAVPVKPLILAGQAWQEVFELFFQAQSAYIQEKEQQLLTFVNQVPEASRVLVNLIHP